MLERGPDVLEPRCLPASVAAYLQTSSSHKVHQQAFVSFCIHFSRGWPTSSHNKTREKISENKFFAKLMSCCLFDQLLPTGCVPEPVRW